MSAFHCTRSELHKMRKSFNEKQHSPDHFGHVPVFATHCPPAQHPLELIAEDFDTKFVLSGDAPDLVVPTSQPELHILLSLLSHMLQTWHTPNAF